jgi:hypothetical protein
MRYDFCFWNVTQIETRRGKLGDVENIRREGRGEVYFHVQSSEMLAPVCVD